MLSIGQVAKQLEIGVETVRFYEREGLLEEQLANLRGTAIRRWRIETNQIHFASEVTWIHAQRNQGAALAQKFGRQIVPNSKVGP